jgi:hypothetical protein
MALKRKGGGHGSRVRKRAKPPPAAPQIQFPLQEHLDLLEAVPVEPSQFFVVRLQGLSSAGDETISEDPSDSGYGIVKMITDSKGVWMRPTTGVDATELPDWPTSTNEYTADYRYMYHVDTALEKRLVCMLTIPDHAVYPCLHSQHHPSSDAIVKHTPLGTKLRFSRSTIKPGKDSPEVDKQYFECSRCKSPLHAEEYVHCRQCDRVLHCACTGVGDKQPLILRDGMFHDMNDEKVQCPTCTESNDGEESYVKSQLTADSDRGSVVNLCIDIGSDVVKASLAWTNDRSATPSFIPVIGTPVSVVWVGKDLLDDKLKVHANADRYAPLRLFNNPKVFQPIKNVLFREDQQDKAEELGIGIEQLFQALFNTLFEKVKLARSPDLTKWAVTANQGSSHPELRLSIALPSGLSMAQKQPVCNALYTTGEQFMKSFGIAHPEVSVSAMPESEMAMLATFESCNFDEHDSTNEASYTVVMDSGGCSSVSFVPLFLRSWD